MSHFEMPVELYMSAPVHTVSPTDSLTTVHRRLDELRISCLAVTDGEALVGVISRTDLINTGRIEAGSRPGATLLTLPEKTAADIMTQEIVRVTPEQSVAHAAQCMRNEGIHRVMVEREGKLVGVLSTADIMHAIRDKRVNIPVSEYMSAPVFSIRAQEPLSEATDRLKKAHVSGLVAVDDGIPVGLFTQTEALSSSHLPRETPVEQAMSFLWLSVGISTPLHRAAAQAAALNVRRALVMDGTKIAGILTGLDFARVAS